MKPEIKKLLSYGLLFLGVWLVIHYWEAAISLLGRIAAAAYPLILGGAIAYVVNIIMSFFEKKLCKKLSCRKVFGSFQKPHAPQARE